jgi:hypothetical protein
MPKTGLKTRLIEFTLAHLDPHQSNVTKPYPKVDRTSLYWLISRSALLHVDPYSPHCSALGVIKYTNLAWLSKYILLMFTYVYCFIVSSACVNSKTRAWTVTSSFIVYSIDIVHHAHSSVHRSNHSRQVSLVFLLLFWLYESPY